MTRFEKKVDSFVWTFILLCPFIVYFIAYFRQETVLDFNTFISGYSFDFIYNMFSSIFTEDLIFSDTLVRIISYMVSVEIIHVFFDFIVFLPRFAHKFLGRCYHD